MWSVPILALALLAIAHASPIPQLPGGQTSSTKLSSESTTSSLSSTISSVASTTMNGESTTSGTTKKQPVTLKKFSFSPLTHKPTTERTTRTPRTFKTLAPFTFKSRTTTTHGGSSTVAGESTVAGHSTVAGQQSTTTTIATASVPIRNARSAQDNWQLSENPSTVPVAHQATHGLTSSPSSGIEHTMSSTTEGAIHGLPTTTAALLPNRRVRNADIDWQLGGAPSTAPVTTTTTTTTTPSTTSATTPSTTKATTPSTTSATTPSTTKATTPSTTSVTTPSTTKATTPSTTKATTPSTPSTTSATTPSTTSATTTTPSTTTTSATTPSTTTTTTKATTTTTKFAGFPWMTSSTTTTTTASPIRHARAAQDFWPQLNGVPSTVGLGQTTTTTSGDLSLGSVSTTSASPLPIRHARAAANFLPADWQLNGASSTVGLGHTTTIAGSTASIPTISTTSATHQPVRRAAGQSADSRFIDNGKNGVPMTGPGWQVGELGSTLPLSDTTTSSFTTGLPTSSVAFGSVEESTTTTFVPSTSSQLPIRNVRSVTWSEGWELEDKPEAVDVTGTTTDESESTTAQLPIRNVRAAADQWGSQPGWQLAEKPDIVQVTDMPAESTTMGDEETTDKVEGPGWEMSDSETDSTVDLADDSTTSAFTTGLPTSSVAFGNMEDFESTTGTFEPTTSLHIRKVRAAGDSWPGQPGWQLAEKPDTVDVTDLPETTTLGDEATTDDIESPGWEMSDSESDSTVDLLGDGSTTSAFTTDHPTSSVAFGNTEESTTGTFEPTTSLPIRKVRAAGDSWPGQPGWQMAEKPDTVEVTTLGDKSITDDVENPGWEMSDSETDSTINVLGDSTTSSFTTGLPTSSVAFGNSLDGGDNWQLSESASTVDIDGTSTSAFPSSSVAFGNSRDFPDHPWQLEEVSSTEAVTEVPEEMTSTWAEDDTTQWDLEPESTSTPDEPIF